MNDVLPYLLVTTTFIRHPVANQQTQPASVEAWRLGETCNVPIRNRRSTPRPQLRVDLCSLRRKRCACWSIEYVRPSICMLFLVRLLTAIVPSVRNLQGSGSASLDEIRERSS